MTKLRTFQTTEELIFQCLKTLRQVLPTLGTSDGVMLAGGRTPLEIYRRAAVEGISTKGKLFLSDERCVPVTDPHSNYGTISPLFNVGQASCLSGQAGSLSYFIKVKTELPIEKAARAFDADLNQLINIPLGLLGLGADGHTASLFNLKDTALRDGRFAIPVIKAEKPDRISVTPALLYRIEKIILLATGAEKKAIIQTLLKKPDTIPAGVALADHPNVEIWTDQVI
ncbi:MAG: 6-phosphogluconolactonase [Kiritimatiellales bacterium]